MTFGLPESTLEGGSSLPWCTECDLFSEHLLFVNVHLIIRQQTVDKMDADEFATGEA